MELKKGFSADLKEAFVYFIGKQIKQAAADPAAVAELEKVTVEQWVTQILRKPVYDLIGEKRANADE